MGAHLKGREPALCACTPATMSAAGQGAPCVGGTRSPSPLPVVGSREQQTN